ncbi:HD domain-containing protein [Bradyrhizobium sp. Arg68]|uniref:HD domain-containing protein n=1 Tax=Bradyrhizobium ivorense TaxID=2511166 RepID=UPI001E5FEA37|nr:HD domain-containing protein [Bradyrhizobium ivorense]MCC8939176.1 HD domain-containing protein [Bradyrhizobium ivorense]
MKPQRVRDPIHGLIVFDDDGLVDESVWDLLGTSEVQRLRRIKQLGVSDYVFPSASHTRLSHSIGVYHNARRLVGILKREIELKRVEGDFNEARAKVALFAALLHDIGHGPFSHAFEEARKALAAEQSTPGAPKLKVRNHEAFTADMIRNPDGDISKILASSGVRGRRRRSGRRRNADGHVSCGRLEFVRRRSPGLPGPRPVHDGHGRRSDRSGLADG